jgi:hypothetical protein
MVVLLINSGNETSSNSSAAFANIEALSCFDGDWVMELDDEFDVITRHDHSILCVGFGLFGPGQGGGLVFE